MAMDMNRMMKQARKMQAQMQEAQEALKTQEYTATVGGGAISATVTGANRVVALQIDPDAVDPDDVEMLQDMVIAAVNEALTQAENDANDRLGSITSGLNIPGLM